MLHYLEHCVPRVALSAQSQARPQAWPRWDPSTGAPTERASWALLSGLGREASTHSIARLAFALA